MPVASRNDYNNMIMALEKLLDKYAFDSPERIDIIVEIFQLTADYCVIFKPLNHHELNGFIKPELIKLQNVLIEYADIPAFTKIHHAKLKRYESILSKL